MRVAVVGAGIYGCAIASSLAYDGHRVVLYEQRSDILKGASQVNQGRVHRGFHYPRSLATAREASTAAPRFEERYAPAIDRSRDHYYGIVEEGLTGRDEYLRFLRAAELKAWVEQPGWLALDLLIRCDETFVDLDRLRGLMWRELAVNAVHVCLETTPGQRELAEYDRVVYARYGRGWPSPLQWEVVEVVLVQLPPMYRRFSLVVLDGPFCSIDPMPDGRHMLYDVRQSVHVTSFGACPEIPDYLSQVVDAGPCAWSGTRWERLVRSAARYVPELAVVAGPYESMVTARAVLPDRNATDDRPVVVKQINSRTMHVLPGKIASCLAAADEVVSRCRE